MIISASYKTDLPAFYGQWFINRLRAGYCKMANPYNNRVIRVSLTQDDVDGIVFWTKNIGPFVKHLSEIHDRGFGFIIQHAINAYPQALERSVVDAKKSVEHLKQISNQFGPLVCVWRYDTIVFSSLTPLEFHLQTFESLCRDLAGVTNEVVISYMHLYKKTVKNSNLAVERFNFDWHDPGIQVKRSLTSQLVEIAKSHGMQLSVCAQKNYLVPGAINARCIDADRLEQISGRKIRVDQRGNRKECGCFESRDIGEYDTCPHGCVYCYAVGNRDSARQRFKQHDPCSEFLLKPSFIDPNEKGANGLRPTLFEASNK